MAEGTENLADDVLKHVREHAETVKFYLDLLQLDGSSPKRHKAGKSHQKQVKRWLTWAEQERHVKIVSAPVPRDVISPDWHASILDVKVFTKHGPDDAVYDANKEIRDKVARGNCFLEIKAGPHQGVFCAVYALRKFTGGLGDDDDKEEGDTFTWKKYFLKPLEETSCVIATKKANGEAAHMSAFKLGGGTCVCAGSKNVHLLFTRKEHIDLYKDSRYTVAREVAHTIADFLESMEATRKEMLLDFLCRTRFTAVFEILNPGHQHVEDLSHLQQPELKFITWTHFPDSDEETATNLCSMPPHVSIEIANALGLPVVDYDIINVSDLDERMIKIRQGYGYEGEVLYFLDSSNSVIGLLKKKTIWYILCRAIREKLKGLCTAHRKNPDTFSISRSINQVEKRIDAIQGWLGLDVATVQAWKKLGNSCMRWTLKSLESGDLDMIKVVEMFPVTWKRFLTETSQSDNVSLKWTEPTLSSD